MLGETTVAQVLVEQKNACNLHPTQEATVATTAAQEECLAVREELGLDGEQNISLQESAVGLDTAGHQNPGDTSEAAACEDAPGAPSAMTRVPVAVSSQRAPSRFTRIGKEPPI